MYYKLPLELSLLRYLMFRRLALPAIILSLLLGATVARAETPTPTSGTGLKHVLQVTDRADTGPAADGTIVELDRVLTRDERLRIDQGAPAPAHCAQLPVKAGAVEVVPVSTPDCPFGAQIMVFIQYPDGSPIITGRIDPPMEWRAAQPGEAPRAGRVSPVQPPTAGSSQPVTLPSTGNAQLPVSASGSSLVPYYLVGLGLILLLTATAFRRAAALLRKRA